MVGAGLGTIRDSAVPVDFEVRELEHVARRTEIMSAIPAAAIIIAYDNGGDILEVIAIAELRKVDSFRRGAERNRVRRFQCEALGAISVGSEVYAHSFGRLKQRACS